MDFEKWKSELEAKAEAVYDDPENYAEFVRRRMLGVVDQMEDFLNNVAETVADMVGDGEFDRCYEMLDAVIVDISGVQEEMRSLFPCPQCRLIIDCLDPVFLEAAKWAKSLRTEVKRMERRSA